MYFLSHSDLPEREIIPGFFAKIIHTDQVTVMFVRVVKGATLPEHHHIHEQMTTLLEGEFEMRVGGVTQRITKGISVVIPSKVPHSAVALTDCRVLDVFHPVREDYK